MEHVLEECQCNGRRCPACKTHMCIMHFTKLKSSKDGLAYQCRACAKRRNAESLKKHKRVTHHKRVDVLVDMLRDEKTRDKKLQQFLAHVEIQEDGCWYWRGNIDRSPNMGYGRFRMAHGSYLYAHRASYELLVGPIPEGMQIDHLCRVRHCVNPDHLEAVRLQENTFRGVLYARGTKNSLSRAVLSLLCGYKDIFHLIGNYPPEISDEIKSRLMAVMYQSVGTIGETIPPVLQQSREGREIFQWLCDIQASNTK